MRRGNNGMSTTELRKRIQNIQSNGGTPLSKIHPSQILKSTQHTQFPFCNKQYANLEPMLMRLELKEGQEKRKPITCPLKPKQMADRQTWTLLLQHNQTYRGKENDADKEIPREYRTKEQRKQQQKTTQRNKIKTKPTNPQHKNTKYGKI